MKLEKLDGKVLVWTDNKKVNTLEYDSSEDKNKYKRWTLSYIEDFLVENNEIEEANKIKDFMGKRLKIKTIPKNIPTGSYKVDVPVKYLPKKIKEFQDEMGLDLNPEFQRGHVWNLEQRIAFIEFLLQEGKVNPIYFNCKGWNRGELGKFVIVDGKQRLTSILMFMNNEFPVYKHMDKDGVGFYAKELDLVNFDVSYVVNELETDAQVMQWYLQMNKGNIAHTKKEIERVEKLLNSIIE